MEKASASMKKYMTMLENEKENLKMHNDTLIKDKERTVQLYAELKEKIEKIKKQQQTLVKEVEDLTRYNASLLEDKKRYSEIFDDLNTQKKIAQEAKETLEEQRANLLQEKKYLEGQIKSFEETKQKIAQESRDVKLQLDKMQADVEGYRQKALMAENKNKDLEAQLEKQKKEYRELSELSTKSLRDNTVLHYNLGVFYTRDGLHDRAVEEFNEALKASPGDPDTNFNLAIIYSEYLNDSAKAVEHFRRYLDTNPREADADKARKYLMLHEARTGR
jgi:tetratricopeptide (TPR) repeat protein